MENQTRKISSWAAIVGKWEFNEDSARYLGPDKDANPPHGIAISNERIRNGTIETTVQFFEHAKESEGVILFGYRASTHPQGEPYYLTGMGGHRKAYILQRFEPGVGWLGLAGAGSSDDTFKPNSQFQIKAKINGQRITLFQNGIKVIEHTLPTPLNGDQLGVFAVGPGPVVFKDTRVTAEKPKLFVVMQYGEPYDSLYREVIKYVAEEKINKFRAFRADDIYKEGVILQDIIESVTESEIVVVEITPPNPNVFYELGYAHALKKTTVLLADRKSPLPFDVRGFRVIFYDDTIKGKKEVETQLQRHLEAAIDELQI